MHKQDELLALAGPYFAANPEATELIGSTATGQFFHPSKGSYAELHKRDHGGELVTVTREKADAAEVAEGVTVNEDRPAPKPKPAAPRAPRVKKSAAAPTPPAVPVEPAAPATPPATA